MNITLLANRDLASNLALNYLYQDLESQHVLRVLLSAQVGGRATKPLALQELAFAEQALFNQMIFPALRSRGGRLKDKLLGFDDLKALGLEINDINSVNCAQGQQIIRDSNPDLIVSVRFGLILKQVILAIPKYGVINLHSGKLPDYRGVMACFRAMQNNEVEHSSTLHYIRDGSIDCGDIISYNTTTLNYQLSYLENVLNLYRGGIKQVLKAISVIERDGVVASYPQSVQGNYYSFPSETEIDDFRIRGLRLFDYAHLARVVEQYL
jgi:methionyl-tRNA formyltransferase